MAKTTNDIVDRLRKAHKTLLADLAKLESQVHPGSETGQKLLTDELTATRTAILEHFRMEEQNGYMGDVRDLEPRMERSITQLAEEHRELTRSLDAILAEAKSTTKVADPLRMKIRDWIERVRHHEHHENQVIQDAYSLDVGAKD